MPELSAAGGAIVNRPTPGPWAVEPQLTPDGRMGDAWNIVADDWPAVAVAEVRREADALLIAAAPELLACVLDVLDADGDLDAMDFNRYRAAIAAAPDLLAALQAIMGDPDAVDHILHLDAVAADAAIAKATGGEA
jgi:hypothetical protein